MSYEEKQQTGHFSTIQILDRKTNQEGLAMYQVKLLSEGNQIVWKPKHELRHHKDLLNNFENQLARQSMNWRLLPCGQNSNQEMTPPDGTFQKPFSQIQQYLKSKGINNRKGWYEVEKNKRPKSQIMHTKEKKSQSIDRIKKRREFNHEFGQQKPVSADNFDSIKKENRKYANTVVNNSSPKQVEMIIIDDSDSGGKVASNNSQLQQFQQYLEKQSDPSRGMIFQDDKIYGDSISLTPIAKNREDLIEPNLQEMGESRKQEKLGRSKKIKRVCNRSKDHDKKIKRKWMRYIKDLQQEREKALETGKEIEQQIQKARVKTIKNILKVNGIWVAQVTNENGQTFTTLRDDLRIRCPESLLQYYEGLLAAKRGK